MRKTKLSKNLSVVTTYNGFNKGTETLIELMDTSDSGIILDGTMRISGKTARKLMDYLRRKLKNRKK